MVGLWHRNLFLSLQAVCAGLLTLVWGVNGINKGDTGWRRLENKLMKKNMDAFANCKSFCLKEYYACYQKIRCPKAETKQRIQLCKEQYHKYMKKCMEEFDSIDFSKWVKKYIWAP